MRPLDADDLSHISDITQQPRESARKIWTRFLTKKNQIVDCPDAQALAAFKHNIRDEWLARHLGQEKPKSMASLTTLMNRFCAGKDSNSTSRNPSTSDARDNNGKPRRNRHKCRNSGDNAEDTAVNAGFSGSKSGQRKKPFKKTIRARPVWIAYSTVHAKFMAPRISKPIIPTGIVRSSSRLAS